MGYKNLYTELNETIPYCWFSVELTQN